MNLSLRTWAACLTLAVVSQAQADPPSFQKLRLTDQFYCEGACFADFDRDGNLDVVSGPFWYEGPEFKARHEIHAPQAFDPKGYSENFLTFAGDFNGDGWSDVFYVPFPGKEGFWYQNPAGQQQPWQKHLAFGSVDNESPMWGDMNGDGKPDLVFNTGGRMGYATYDISRPSEPWTFHAVTPPGDYQRFSHGIGLGDIDGDGRMDLLEKDAWWQQPAETKEGEPWIKHAFKFADAACQMLAYDVDGDGLQDVITVWHCHHYGLVWHQQVRGAEGQIDWKQHVILPSNPDVNSSDLRISQLHALELVDMDGDGLQDLLTGKRFWAHGPTGDPEPDAPAVVYWFQLQRDGRGGVQFVPHQIDDDSGVGTQVAAADLNGDGLPDVIVGNKKGTFVHLSQK